MRKYIAEFIGTFFLVLVVTVSGEPLAIGAILMVMVFAGGHISGAHYNPAVTLAILIRKKITINEAIPYFICQVIGGISAALLANWFLGGPQTVSMDLNDKTMQALVAEVLGTFALAFVVLNVATTKGTAGNSFYGLAIGFTVFACATALGKFSGGAFNPAVAIGASVIKAFAWKNIWIYLVGCFGGAIIAALVFNFINIDDKQVPPLPKTD
ncbi:MAG: aquaporin [Bacteroidota bacterium]|nr:aquaporin [Bacteroidota bacterium]